MDLSSENIIASKLEKFKEKGLKEWLSIYTIFKEINKENVQKKRWILLDQLHVKVSSLQKSNNEEFNHYMCDLTQLMCQLYFTHIMCSRTNQRINKVLQVLYNFCPDIVKSVILGEINAALTRDSPKESLQKLFVIIDSWKLGRSCIEDDLEKIWLQIIGDWSKDIMNRVKESYHTNIVNFQDTLQLVIKISLQMFQHFAEKIQHFLQVKESIFDQARDNLTAIVSLLVSVLFSEHLAKECLLLSGTSLCLFLNIEHDNDKVLVAIFQLLHCAGMDVESNNAQGVLTMVVNGININLPTPSKQPITLIALLQAFITSCRKDIILYREQNKKGSFLTNAAFATICQLCKTEKTVVVHYLSYEVLKSWISRVSNLLQDIHKADELILFGIDTFHTNNILELVWDSVEDPVDGISISGRATFHLLLEAHREERRFLQTDKTMGMFYGSVLDKVLSIPWQVKAKYGLLCEILPYVDLTEVFLKSPALLNEMAECLNSNQLSSASTEVLKAFFMKSKLADHQSFQDSWVAVLLKSLTSDNRLLAQHTRQYWLPCALKCLPHTLHTLLNQLSGSYSNGCHGDRNLSAKLAILKVARSLGILDSTELDDVILGQAILHQEDSLRLEALGVLCCDVKTSKPLVDIELKLLREFIPHNLNIACPSFRQDLIGSLKKVLCRIRDSSLYSLKKSFPKVFKKPMLQAGDVCDLTVLSTDIQNGLEFVQWLFTLTSNCLVPGANYQRQKTALELLSIMFDTFGVSENPDKKKGQAPESCRILMALAEQKGLWTFYSPRSVHIFLGCLLSSHSDIRELSLDVLRKQFTAPFQPLSKRTSDMEFGLDLLREARTLICSAKAQECESGSVLCELIFESYAVRLGWHFVDVFGDISVQPVNESHSLHRDVCIEFLKELVVEAERQLIVAKSDLALAAEEGPIHGIFLTLCRCISSYLDINGKSVLFSAVIQHTVEVVIQSIDYLLGVLSKKQDSQNVVCGASFAGLGEAVSDAVSSSTPQSDITKSQQHKKEYIMSCCFLTIKFGCHLLATIVEKTFHVSSEHASCATLLTTSTLTSIGDMFIKIFTQCRLTGILLSCKLSLMDVCRCFSGSDEECLHSLPRKWIQDVINAISGEGAASSVTRRSAGLPVLIANILASEIPSRRPLTVKHCLDELLKLALKPIPDVIDQTTDLPQVHAVNILRSLYQDTSLGNEVLRYTEQGFILAVNGFASSLWSVRNASTQLFGSLVLRTLGHKRGYQDENQVNSISARDFFKRFSSLREFFLEKLNSFSVKDTEQASTTSVFLKPELFPILTLLSKLRPASCSVEENLLADFIPALTPLSSNPVYAVRALAAQALVPFIPIDNVFGKAADLLHSVPCSSVDVSQNHIHGTLLQVHRLVNSVTIPQVNHQALPVMEELIKRPWLGTDANACAITRAEYLTLFIDVASLITNNDALYESIQELTADDTLTDSNVNVRVGTPSLQQAIVRVKMYKIKKFSSPKDVSEMESLLKNGLCSVEREERIATLECINELLEKEHILDIDEPLTSLITMETLDQRCLLLALECFIKIKYYSDKISTEMFILLWKALLSYTKRSRGSTVQSKAIIVLSILLRSFLKQSNDFRQTVSMATDWSCSIKSCGLPSQPEPVRSGAAIGLGLVGGEMLQWAEQYKECDLDLSVVIETVVRVFQTGVTLLEDEQDDVRIAASNFGAKIQRNCHGNSDVKSVTCSVAMDSLFDYMARNFYWSSDIWIAMVTLIRGRSVPDLLSEYIHSRRMLFEQEDCNLYAEPFVTIQHACKYIKEMADVLFYKKTASSQSFNVWCRKWLNTEFESFNNNINTLKNRDIQDGGSLQNPKLFILRYRLVMMSDVMKYVSSSIGHPVVVDESFLSKQILDVLSQLKKTSLGCHPLLHELQT